MRHVFAIALLAGACRVAPPEATAVDAARAQVDLAELREGRTLLIGKCGGACHKVPLPSQHSPADWPGKLDEMSARAGLDPHQHALIEKYLITLSTAGSVERGR
jgi:hypothetical protein